MKDDITRRVFATKCLEIIAGFTGLSYCASSAQASSSNMNHDPMAPLGSQIEITNLTHYNFYSKERQDMDIEELIFHHTAGFDAESAIQTLLQRGLSYGYLIDLDGTIMQLVPDKKIAFHTAGERNKYEFNGPSIGICNVNPGAVYKDGSLWRTVNGERLMSGTPWDLYKEIPTALRKKTQLEFGGERFWVPYTQAQVNSSRELTAFLMAKYNINPKNLFTHHDVNNSICPGPAFPKKEII